MNLGRTVVAVSLDHDRLFALIASVSGDRVAVKSCITAQIPPEVDARDADSFGKWLGSKLREVGTGRARIVFAVTRGEVVLKRLRLPRPPGGESELAGMVRLQMARQLTLALEGTAIDYMLVGEDPAEAGGQAMHVSVLAGALPGDRVGWCRQAARAAGCRLERIGLLASGAAAILASVSQRHSGPVLGIAAGPASMEFLVVQDGHLVFARAAELGDEPPPDAAAARESLVQRAAIEAKRTWMSYRVGQDSAEIDAVVVPGEGELARQIARRCGDSLEMQWRLAMVPENVTFPGDMPEEQRLVAVPLAGLLGERILARPTLDFAHPRRAPDWAARRRQLALLAALVLLGVGGVGYLFAAMELRDLRQQLAEASEAGSRLRDEQRAHLRDQARLGHLRAWSNAGVDWMAHTSWLAQQMPDPQQARLERLSGNLASRIEYVSRSSSYDMEAWRVHPEARLGVSGVTGQGRDREAVNQLRTRLVSSPVYERVDTQGADVAERFAFILVSPFATPEEAAEKARAPAQNGRGSGG
jgi:Tfp pilus assembly PilM family ATPase